VVGSIPTDARRYVSVNNKTNCFTVSIRPRLHLLPCPKCHQVSLAIVFGNIPLFPDFGVKLTNGGIMGRRWTDQDIEQLKLMAPIHPAPTIAEMIDRTVGGVVFKANQLKVSLQSRRQIELQEEST
jgi:hypothetical protein